MEQTETKNNEANTVPATPSTKGKNIGMAVVAYFIFFLPLLTDAKNDAFVLFHVRQAFIIFIGFIVTGVVMMIPTPLIFFGFLAQIGLIVLSIIGIVHALGGKEEPLPLIGQFINRVPF